MNKRKMLEMFNISRNTLDLWLHRVEQTGNCRAIVNYQQGCGYKITDWERFRAFVQQHGDKTQAQMASLWGDNVTGKIRIGREERIGRNLSRVRASPL